MLSFAALAREISEFIRRQPLRAMAVILSTLVALAAANYTLHKSLPDRVLETPLWFLFPQTPGFVFNAVGLPYAAAFLVLLFGSAALPQLRRGILGAWFIGLAFILLGNLIQGGAHLAFQRPLIASGFQYYHDALKIDSWVDWLAQFNEKQAGLFVHSQTHPPFAVLLHYLLLQVMGERPLQLAAVMIVITSLSIPILSVVFSELGLAREARNALAVLFSLIPAVNIYAAVSLDGIVIATSAVFLLGLLMLMRRPAFSFLGATLFVGGVVLTNLLSFAGLFLLAVGATVGALELFARRSRRILLVTAGAVVILGGLIFGLHQFGQYDHIQAFLTASRIENPQGFRGFADPLNYILSRLECFGEIALFFSIGLLAVLFRTDRIPIVSSGQGSDAVRVGLVGISVLALMFIAGVYRVGETARASLFIYPWLMLLLVAKDQFLARDLMILAGLQTVLMQLFSRYFW